MMKPYTWSPDHTLEEQKNGAYWERNVLALLLAVNMSPFTVPGTEQPAAGWYRHPYEIGIELPPQTAYWELKTFSHYGWSRVISIYGGGVTFHVPDDFDLGALPEIQPDWDGHTTEQKWLRIMDMCGCKLPTPSWMPMDSMSVQLQKRIDGHIVKYGKPPEALKLHRIEMDQLESEWRSLGVPLNIKDFLGVPIEII